jgi:DNA-binding CsgD family transcriptional regulator
MRVLRTTQPSVGVHLACTPIMELDTPPTIAVGLILGYGAISIHGSEGFCAELASEACIFNDAPETLESTLESVNADLRRAVAAEYGVPCIALEAAISIGFLQEMGVAPQAVEQLKARIASGRRPPVLIYWTELSRRDQHVARLVAQGLTNREISESMCLGGRIVEMHIYGLMAKTGSRSRTDLARWVTRHDE